MILAHAIGLKFRKPLITKEIVFIKPNIVNITAAINSKKFKNIPDASDFSPKQTQLETIHATKTS